ncbi:MAG TPA: 2-oxoglutarate dehydrogenase E1 component [Candidatus Binatia bacterium]|nr:2-oxoglutarate dehydrogenase E1 component [Candidatus Binatia bacterium]
MQEIREENLPGALNLSFVEGLYADYLRDRDSVAPEWREYFDHLANGDGAVEAQLGPSFRPFSLFNPPSGRAIERQLDGARPSGVKQERVDQLIRAYRFRGHMIARINPLGFPRSYPPELDPKFYGLTPADMEQSFSCETLVPQGRLTLAEILDRLWNTYCRSIGVEYMHIDAPSVRQWLQERMEWTQNRLPLSREEQLRILTRLTDAVTFEEFIRKKFVGAKSFSLEGSESLIPLLDLAIERAGEQGIREIVLGMAHRGRLNVLANIMGKSPRRIFREFADADAKLFVGGGDVKYHLGHSTEWVTATGQKIHLSLCFNPSHLEFVDPVVLGRVRAKQDRFGDRDRRLGLALLIHGDAAFAAQGLIQEILNLSELPSYTVGGTLHVIANNQIGFTTGPEEGRSTAYATDVAKMLQIPIFHVNGEDPEAVAQVVKLAMDFRQSFRRDVVVDMYAYRRLGHNESDEPAFTQPLLYDAIRKRKPVREAYVEHLLKLNGITQQEADDIATRRQELLEKELSRSREKAGLTDEKPHGIWAPYVGGPEPADEPETGVEQTKLSRWLEALSVAPQDFHPHPKIKKWLEIRRQMARGEQPLDWSAGEALAFASLASEGVRIRLTGQDTARGTFSQRHAVLYDVKDGHAYTPLEHLHPTQGPVEIKNSPLSESGVLGFEYGYSLDYPDALVAWEAQFGDFWNAAQVIVDQFISSAEDKWKRLNGIVMLLPHGFEGAGPEHSSARLERFLTLAAEDNMQIACPSTPAQYFHCLRRQVVRPWRKPLVVMTPKSLLRHPKVVSSLAECARGSFQRILPDRSVQNPKRILLCTGKIYYELDKFREDNQRNDVAIVRVEQFYPLRLEHVQAVLSPYAQDVPTIWVQEEPENMGAWYYMQARFAGKLQRPFSGIYRAASASPATGSAASHKAEQSEIIEAAFK